MYVTLVVFAGRPDPQWLIGLNNTNSCGEYNCTEIQSHLTKARQSNYVYSHSCIPLKTGYKGFLVQTEKEGEVLIVGPETVTLQLLLLESMPESLKPTGALHQRIRSEIVSGTVSQDCTKYTFHPAPWNTNENTRRLNNCYNYANIQITNSYAQPGRGSGGPFFPWITPDAVRDAAVLDGLHVVPPPANGHLVALFFAKG